MVLLNLSIFTFLLIFTVAFSFEHSLTYTDITNAAIGKCCQPKDLPCQ